jgi:hypothetical protein
MYFICSGSWGLGAATHRDMILGGSGESNAPPIPEAVVKFLPCL